MSTKQAAGILVDDFTNDGGISALGTRWSLVSDRVMGGVSDGRMNKEQIEGRVAICLRGQVSLENNVGFLQLALDLSRDGLLDAGIYDGVRLVVRGNSDRYSISTSRRPILVYPGSPTTRASAPDRRGRRYGYRLMPSNRTASTPPLINGAVGALDWWLSADG